MQQATSVSDLTIAQRTLVMGIVNVTEDSFSDGGKWLDVDAAINHARELVAQGADMIDVGGESTRPGGLTADVNHVSALRHEFAGVVDGGIDVQPLTAIGEGILRDVDNAHHQRALGNGQIRYRGCLLHGVLLLAFVVNRGFSCESG